MTEPTHLPNDRAYSPSTDKPSLEPVEHPDRVRNEKLPHPTGRFVIATRRVRVRIRRGVNPC